MPQSTDQSAQQDATTAPPTTAPSTMGPPTTASPTMGPPTSSNPTQAEGDISTERGQYPFTDAALRKPAILKGPERSLCECEGQMEVGRSIIVESFHSLLEEFDERCHPHYTDPEWDGINTRLDKVTKYVNSGNGESLKDILDGTLNDLESRKSNNRHVDRVKVDWLGSVLATEVAETYLNKSDWHSYMNRTGRISTYAYGPENPEGIPRRIRTT